MTLTVVSSATKEVAIGFGRPFVMIGERINPTGRKLLAEEMRSGDFSRVEADAMAQTEAGAHMLDVNAGIPLADEPALLAQAIKLVQSVTDVPLSIDSSIIEALEAGLAVYQGKPLINSVTGEDEVLERVLPLVARHGAAVVAISNDETGISEDPDVRFEVARKIVNRAADHGIATADVVVDPLVMPIGAMGTAGQQVFRLVRRLREEAGGEHHLWCQQCELRTAGPAPDHRHVPVHGDRRGDDLGHHEPAAPRGQELGDGGRRACWPRPRLRGMDRRAPGSHDRGHARWPSTDGPASGGRLRDPTVAKRSLRVKSAVAAYVGFAADSVIAARAETWLTCTALCSTRRASAPPSRQGEPFWTPPARAVWTSTRSAGDGACAAAARFRRSPQGSCRSPARPSCDTGGAVRWLRAVASAARPWCSGTP